MPRNKKRKVAARPRKPVLSEQTIKLAHKQTALNLIEAGNIVEQARQQFVAAQQKFNDLISGVLTENGIENAELKKVTAEPPEIVLVVKARLKATR